MACVDKNNKLYYNLTKITGDEKKAQDLYSRIMNPEFLSDYKIKIGKDGVPNFHDVYKKANLKTVLDDEKYINVLNKDLVAKTLKNTQENVGILSEEVTRFNNSNKMKEFVAVIEKDGDTISSKVVRKNYKTDLLSKKIKTNTDLNNFLISKLSEIGVGVGEITELERRRGIAGVTEFDRAKDATNGIVNLIRISNDKAGMEALPEEFAHFALEAIGENNNLVSRLYNSLSDEVVQIALGDEYEQYMEEYNGDFEKLRKEAAGKMLAEYIKADYTGANIPLINRVFDAIKDKFRDIDENELRKALIDLDATLTKAAKEILHTQLLNEVGIVNITENSSKLYNLNVEEFDKEKGIQVEDEEKVYEDDDDDYEVVDDEDDVVSESQVVDFDQNQGFSEDEVEVAEDDEDVEYEMDEDEGDYEVDSEDDDEVEYIEEDEDYDINNDDVDYEEENARISRSKIDVVNLREQFKKDCEEIAEALNTKIGFELKAIKDVFTNIESSLTKRKKINEKRGQKDNMTYSDKKIRDYIYKHKNMLGNILNFIYQSIETLNHDWNYYENTKASDINGKCNQLLIFSNTIKSLEYVLNNTDIQNIMDVSVMSFEGDGDNSIINLINKYAEKLSFILKKAQNFVQNEETVLAKSFLKEKFGDTFEIPMTLSDSQVLTVDNELTNDKQVDVSWITRMFSSLANSPSLILKMVDQIAKRSNDNRRNKVFEERRKIIALGKKYVDETGSADFDWLYETDDSGARTGYYISDMNMGEYDKYYQEIVLDKKDYWLPGGELDSKAYKEIIEKFNEVAKEHNGFHNPKWDRLTKAQKEFAIEFQKRKMELDDKMYSEVHNATEEEEFWDEIEEEDFLFGNDRKKAKEEFKKKKRSLRTVKIGKSLINKLKTSKGINSAMKEIGQTFKEMFVKTNKDIELAKDNAYLTDFEGKRVYDIPKMFTMLGENETEENMSMDPISTLIAYADASENRYEKLQITGMIDVITEVINRRRLADGSKGKNIFKKLKTTFGEFELPITVNGYQSNISKMLHDYKESQIYGMWNNDMGNIAGTNISKDKLLNTVLSQTALTGMALNVLGGISNVDTGRAMMRIESIAGEFFNMKDVAKADIEYTKNIGAVIADAGELIKSTKLGIFIEQFNVIQEYEKNILHTEFDANRFARCCSEQGMFIFNNMGEHYLQTRTALAIAIATKLKDKNGKEITLWDAMELVDIDSKHPEYGKKITLKEGVTKADGTEIGDLQDYLNKFTHKAQALNQRMHGIYNYEDRCAVQRYAVGRMFYQFRKYIPVSIHRMFGKVQYNFDLDAPTEGYYRTFGKMMLKIYKEAKAQRCSIFNTGVWKNMKDWERKNCIRSIVGLSQTLLIYGAVMITESLMGDSPKKSPWALKLMNYRYRRLYSELAAFTPSLGMVNEGLKIIDSPFAACRILDKNIEFLEVLKPWNWTEDAIIEQGKYKGKYEGQKAVLQMLPVYNAMINIFDPYEATKFYKQ